MPFPSTWTKRVKITIPAAQVGSGGVSNFTVLLTEASLPASIFTDARSDGGDIRASIDRKGSGQQLGVDLIDWDAGAETALIRVGPMNLSALAANEFWIWYSNPGATLPAAGDDFGQYDAYSSWAGYWPDAGTSNRTNGTAATGSGGVTVGGVAGKVGTATDFDGSDDHVQVQASPILNAATAWTMMAWIQTSAASNVGGRPIYCERAAAGNDILKLDSQDGTSTTQIFVTIRNDGGTLAQVRGTSVAINDGAWRQVAAVRNGTAITLYVNGAADGSGGTWGGADNFTNASRVSRISGDPAFAPGRVDGNLGEVNIHASARSLAWIKTEYNQVNAPGTFATAGTPETVGGIAVIMNHLKQQGIS